VNTLRRLLRHRLTPFALVVAATLLLPGRFVGDPVLLDSLSLRVKAKVVSLVGAEALANLRREQKGEEK